MSHFKKKVLLTNSNLISNKHIIMNLYYKSIDYKQSIQISIDSEYKFKTCSQSTNAFEKNGFT